jgi:phospholipid transport system substrate-binding protein
MKKLLIIVLLLMLGTTSSWAADPEKALEVVQSTAQQMLDAIRQNRASLTQDPSRLYNLVNSIAVPHFDFEIVSQLVLGKHWQTASAAQRQRFTEEFRKLMIRTYAKALLEYADTEITYLPMRPSKRDDQVTVRSQVQPNSGPPVPMDYAMCLSGGAWKVCNITIDKSINFVVNYRKQLSSQIRSQGLDQVIADLSARNAEAK